jgi:hypothetical protein
MPELVLEKLSWRKDWMEAGSVKAAEADEAKNVLTIPTDRQRSRRKSLLFM